MDAEALKDKTLSLKSCMRIMALLPDDGSDRHLMQTLRLEKGVNRVDSVPVRAVAMLQEAETRDGRLPESALARVVTAIVEESEADSIFGFIYDTANVGRPGGGMLLMDRLLGATGYQLPDGVPDEKSSRAASQGVS